jgi:hypothetical protein
LGELPRLNLFHLTYKYQCQSAPREDNMLVDSLTLMLIKEVAKMDMLLIILLLTSGQFQQVPILKS